LGTSKGRLLTCPHKEMVAKIISLLTNENNDLLPLQEVQSILKAKSKRYRGMKAVPVASIAGSEGRYRDFNRNFLPKHKHLRDRWVSIQVAHYQDKILPPIRIYEIGGIYFVRDGNHRVSVAVEQGVEFIDAEVTQLGSDINLRPGATKEEIKRMVIAYEKERFLERTELDKLRPENRIEFTETGRYDDTIEHINVHKYYRNLDRREEISFEEGTLSWYDTIYFPMVVIIREEKIIPRFAGRTEADLYVWIVRHWDELKKKYGEKYSMRDAARDYSRKHGKSFTSQVMEIIRITLKRIFRR